MAETPDLNAALRESAAGPKSITIDGQSSSEHSLTEQIEAIKFQQATKARGKVGFGISIAKLRPHGAVLNNDSGT